MSPTINGLMDTGMRRIHLIIQEHINTHGDDVGKMLSAVLQ